MSELPARPDLDQLRRQARESRRAATDGQPSALARLRVVSDRIALSTAQLALARDYGFPSWAALVTEVRRRSSGVLGDRWSLNGGSPVNTAEGVLHPGVLRVSSDEAAMDARLVSVVPPRDHTPRLGDVAVTDEHGSRYHLSAMGWSISDDQPAWLRIQVHPVPARECGWLELRGQDGSVTRLVPSLGRAASVGAPAPLSDAAPTGRRLSENDPADDGSGRYLDVTAELPRIDDTTIRLESLCTERNGWRLYLSATPGWWLYGAHRPAERPAVTVAAEDDRGGTYVTSLGGGALHEDHEEGCALFQPALDPLARAVTLTFLGTDTQVAVRVDLDFPERVG